MIAIFAAAGLALALLLSHGALALALNGLRRIRRPQVRLCPPPVSLTGWQTRRRRLKGVRAAAGGAGPGGDRCHAGTEGIGFGKRVAQLLRSSIFSPET